MLTREKYIFDHLTDQEISAALATDTMVGAMALPMDLHWERLSRWLPFRFSFGNNEEKFIFVKTSINSRGFYT
jgi:hypothetical protein